MAGLTIDDVKSYLDVIHSADDGKLQLLLDAVLDEARNFMDRDNLTDWSDTLPEDVSEPVSEVAMPNSVKLGVLILVQAAYQSSPAEQAQLRDVAEIKLMPYRKRLGV
jgi:hypothetical protein